MVKSREIRGVCPVLATPFHGTGEVDFESLAREIDFELEAGAQALVLFGLASETYKLIDAERRQICEFTVDRLRGRVPLVVGSEHTGVEAAAERSHEAQEMGADAVMLYPPGFVKPDAAGILDYYQTVSQGLSIPIVIQDGQSWTGVPLSPSLLGRISRLAERVRYVKVESLPTGPKMSAIQAEEPSLQVLGGYGSIYYPDEYRRGAAGTFLGAAVVDIFANVTALFQLGDGEGAERLFHRYLPLLVFQLSSLDTHNQVQKILFERAGIFTTAQMRRPHQPMDRRQHEELEELVRRLPLKVLARS